MVTSHVHSKGIGGRGVVSRCILAGVKAKKSPLSARTKLEKELRDAIAEIDEEGLLFLLRQAQVLIHNARVDKLTREPGRPSGAAAPQAQPAKNPVTVAIETSEGGKTIFLTLGKARKVLTHEEMQRIVRICYAAESKSEALRRLFTVLAKERRDILADAIIGNPDNPLLVGLFDAVRARYRLEEH
jgi:hypothetical protein